MFAPYVSSNRAISLKPFMTLISARLCKLNLMPYTTITNGILLVGPLLRIWLGVSGFFVSNEIRMAPLIVTRHRYKARLVAKGFHQRPGCDFTETFSPVVKPVTIRIVITLAVRQGWSLRQLDVNNAFLQGTLKEEVFMLQPPEFVDKTFPDHICRLKRALCGLKQAPRAWYTELRIFVLSLGFVNSTADASVFIHRKPGVTLYLLVYVNDIIVTRSSPVEVSTLIATLAALFFERRWMS